MRITAVLMFTPQMIIWHETFGFWIGNPQKAVMGNGFFVKPALWQMAFSGYHGLFSWHPIFGMALIGLAFAEGKRMAFAVLAIFAVQFVINASAIDWWAGCSFGARRFCDVVPCLMVGMVALLERFKSAWFLTYGLYWWSMALYNNAINPNAPLTLDKAVKILHRTIG